MSSHHQLNPQFLVDTLYCEEQHWDNQEEEDNSIDNSNTLYHNHPPFSEENLWEDDDPEVSTLLQKEQETQLQSSLEHKPCLAKARGEAVEWILNVVHYYSFSPLTAVLAVNYLDRFLHSFQSHAHADKPWMTQLAAVSCISLAAKVEETQVPLLLDLQVEESKYVFESKTIQRMEILVLSTLEWKMNPVTPLSFLDYIATKLGFFPQISRDFLGRCHCLLLSLLSDCRFMSYLPSAMATATMLYVITSVEPTIATQNQEQLLGILGIEKEEVENCCRLIEEVATRADFHWFNKRKFPGSPKGVVDVCFSSDADHSPAPSVSSSPTHFSKKLKSK